MQSQDKKTCIPKSKFPSMAVSMEAEDSIMGQAEWDVCVIVRTDPSYKY